MSKSSYYIDPTVRVKNLYKLLLCQKFVYKHMIAFIVAILSRAAFVTIATPLIPESSCQDLLNVECVNDTAQCCFDHTNPSPGDFVACKDNQFVIYHCGKGSTCNSLPDIGNVECVDRSGNWVSELKRSLWVIHWIVNTVRCWGSSWI